MTFASARWSRTALRTRETEVPGLMSSSSRTGRSRAKARASASVGICSPGMAGQPASQDLMRSRLRSERRPVQSVVRSRVYVMQDDEMPVPGRSNVEFDDLETALDRLSERHERVLGHAIG